MYQGLGWSICAGPWDACDSLVRSGAEGNGSIWLISSVFLCLWFSCDVCTAEWANVEIGGQNRVREFRSNLEVEPVKNLCAL